MSNTKPNYTFRSHFKTTTCNNLITFLNASEIKYGITGSTDKSNSTCQLYFNNDIDAINAQHLIRNKYKDSIIHISEVIKRN